MQRNFAFAAALSTDLSRPPFAATQTHRAYQQSTPIMASRTRHPALPAAAAEPALAGGGVVPHPPGLASNTNTIRVRLRLLVLVGGQLYGGDRRASPSSSRSPPSFNPPSHGSRLKKQRRRRPSTTVVAPPLGPSTTPEMKVAEMAQHGCQHYPGLMAPAGDRGAALGLAQQVCCTRSSLW